MQEKYPMPKYYLFSSYHFSQLFSAFYFLQKPNGDWAGKFKVGKHKLKTLIIFLLEMRNIQSKKFTNSKVIKQSS